MKIEQLRRQIRKIIITEDHRSAATVPPKFASSELDDDAPGSRPELDREELLRKAKKCRTEAKRLLAQAEEYEHLAKKA